MIACPSCTSARPDCRLQQSADRRGQLQCQHCWRYFVFVAAELLELDEAASQGFDSLDPVHSMCKRRNLLIAADLLNPTASTNKPEDLQRHEQERRELEQLRAPTPTPRGASTS
jgi:hypothetical protein